MLLAEVDIDDETVEAGFAVKNEPADGSAPAVFETLDDIAVAAGLNALHLTDYDYNPTVFEGPDGPFAAAACR